MSLHDALPTLEKVFHKDWVLGVIGLDQSGEEGSDFFGLWWERDGLACESGERVREISRCLTWEGRRGYATYHRRSS